MIASCEQADCPFCALEAERIVDADDLTVTILDGWPVAPGHTLVLTRRHIPSLRDATMEEQRALLAAVGRARARLDEELHPDGYNIGINDGVAAGQTVMHLHVHVIPRVVGDTPNPRGGVRRCLPHGGCSEPLPRP